MTEKELLEEQLKQLSNVTPETLGAWRTETFPIISEIFGEKTPQYNQFANIGGMAMSGYTVSHIDSFKNCLNGMIKCMSIRKASRNVKPESNNKVVINNNPQFSQSQTQTQTQTMDIKDIIKDELPPAKMREIEEILQNEEAEKTKLEKVGEVLQKVGIGVTSSVLARIITSSMGVF